MAVMTVTGESFESVINLPGIVVLDFWAAWCPPCRGFKPVFEAASEKNPDITFGSVNTEEQTGLAASLQVSSIPTIMLFRDGILVYAEAGALPAPAFADLLTQARALDMDAIRAEIEAMRANPDAIPEELREDAELDGVRVDS